MPVLKALARSDKVLAGGRKLDGPRSGPGLQDGGNKAAASSSEIQDLRPGGLRERGEYGRSSCCLEIALCARSLAPPPSPEDARDVFSGDVEVGSPRPSQAGGRQVQANGSFGALDAQSRKPVVPPSTEAAWTEGSVWIGWSKMTKHSIHQLDRCPIRTPSVLGRVRPSRLKGKNNKESVTYGFKAVRVGAQATLASAA